VSKESRIESKEKRTNRIRKKEKKKQKKNKQTKNHNKQKANSIHDFVPDCDDSVRQPLRILIIYPR
tara:strand:+ start:631 stop:828 length:198 start_codon:yes stop_codon:yes gene_type:complete